MWHLGTLLSGGLSSAGLMFGHDDLRGFFQLKQFDYSVNLALHQSRGQGFAISQMSYPLRYFPFQQNWEECFTYRPD